MSDNIQKVTVLSKTTWTPNLFSFTVSRPDSFKFTAGQFVRLGVNPSQLNYYKQLSAVADTDDDDENLNETLDEDIFRAYSIVSSPFDEVLEFSRRYQCYIPWYTYKLSIDPGKRWSRVEIEMHVYDELVIVDESEGIYIRDED